MQVDITPLMMKGLAWFIVTFALTSSTHRDPLQTLQPEPEMMSLLLYRHINRYSAEYFENLYLEKGQNAYKNAN